MILDNKTKTALKALAKTQTWKIVRDEFIQKFIDTEIKDVTKPLNYGNETIPADKSYLAKALAARKVEEMIRYISGFERQRTNTSIIEDYK